MRSLTFPECTGRDRLNGLKPWSEVEALVRVETLVRVEALVEMIVEVDWLRASDYYNNFSYKEN